MKANELRIGNLISFDGEIKIVNSHVLTFMEVSEKRDKPIPFSPIPLDEDQLLKFGFTFSDVGVRKDNCYLLDVEDRYFMDGYGGNREVRYVHQLQNLYFALTGKELNI